MLARGLICISLLFGMASWLSPYVWGPSSIAVAWGLAALAVATCLVALGCSRDPASVWLNFSNWFLVSIAFCAGVSACMGLAQWIRWDQALGGLVARSGGEVYANLRQRNHLATLLCIGWFIAAQLLIANRYRKLLLVVMPLMVACLAATASRTGAILLTLLATAYALFSAEAKKCAVITWLGFSALVLTLPALGLMLNASETNLMARFDDPNAYSRTALWSNVAELVAKSPWTGHGWRSLAYLHYSTDFEPPRFMEMLDNAHNLPLHLAVELGVPVALAFCALVTWAVWRGRPWSERRWDRQMAWAVVLVIGIHSMVEYPLWYGPFFMTMLAAIGILTADCWQKWYSALTQSAQYAIDLGVKLFACVLLAFLAYVAWDYHRVSQIYLPPEQRSSAYARDPLAAAQKSLLFQNHAQFAELQITPLTQASAPRILDLSLRLVKWSPEPRIIEKLIESAVMLGQDDVAQFHIRRYRIAYPQAYAKWSQSRLSNGDDG